MWRKKEEGVGRTFTGATLDENSAQKEMRAQSSAVGNRKRFSSAIKKKTS